MLAEETHEAQADITHPSVTSSPVPQPQEKSGLSNKSKLQEVTTMTSPRPCFHSHRPTQALRRADERNRVQEARKATWASFNASKPDEKTISPADQQVGLHSVLPALDPLYPSHLTPLHPLHDRRSPKLRPTWVTTS